MKRKIAFYVLTHIPTGFYYVGSTRNLYRRLENHKHTLNFGKHSNHKLQSVYTRWSDIAIKSTECLSIEDAVALEQKALEESHGKEKCCNLYSTAFVKTVTGGWKHTEESREKRRIASTGKRHTPESLKKMSEWQIGRKFSPEVRQRMSEVRRGKPFSGHQLDWTGRKHSEESIEKMRISQTGVLHSEETKNKIRAYAESTGRRVSVEGVIYPTISHVARAYGIDHRTVRGRVDSKSERFANWFYADKGISEGD